MFIPITGIRKHGVGMNEKSGIVHHVYIPLFSGKDDFEKKVQAKMSGQNRFMLWSSNDTRDIKSGFFAGATPIPTLFH